MGAVMNYPNCKVPMLSEQTVYSCDLPLENPTYTVTHAVAGETCPECGYHWQDTVRQPQAQVAFRGSLNA